MARTQALDYDKRRDAIMQTAADLYAAQGFLGTSVAEIARAGAISKSLLYHYYQSKEDILFDVMDSHIEALVEATKAVLAQDAAPADKVRALSARLMEVYVGAQSHQKVLLNELVNLPEARRQAVIDHQRWLLDAVDQLVSEIRPDLAQDRARRRATTMLFFGMLNWTHTWYDPKGPVSPPDFAAMSAETFLAGLRATAS